MKDQIAKDLTRKGEIRLSREVVNFKPAGLLASGNDERGG